MTVMVECSYCFEMKPRCLELITVKGDGFESITRFCSAQCLYNSLSEYMEDLKEGGD